MKNDNKVIAKIPDEEKREYVDLGERLDMSMGQIVREALQRFKPIMQQRLAEKEQAISAPTGN